MEIARLVLDYLGVVAWPLVTVALLFAFRQSIRAAVKRLTTFEGFGFKANLAQIVDEATEVASEPTSSTKKPSSVPAHPDLVPHFHLTSYGELRNVGVRFRDGERLLVDVSGMPETEAKRAVDFLAGAVLQSRGTLERRSSKDFLITPGSPQVEKSSP